ncbi:host cell division inhibitor Icd-like protein [Providencia rettgeri]
MSISLNYIPARNIQHVIVKNNLPLLAAIGYSEKALAKSSVRIGVLNIVKATHDAPSVFFCVHAYAHLLNAVLYRAYSMVAAAEQPQGWLVSFTTSNANSTVVTTPEIGVSRGDSYDNVKEIIIMMAIPTQTHSKFIFLAVKRSDIAAKPCRIETSAPNERTARLSLARDYVLLFAGHIPAKAVAHV